MRITIEHERGTDLAGMRRENLHRVLDVVRRHPGSSQNDVSARTGLAVGAISSLVNELRDAGLLVEAVSAPSGSRGRPKRAVDLADGAVAVVGVTLTRSRLAARAATLRGSVRGEAAREFARPLTPAQAAEALPQVVDAAIGAEPADPRGPRIVIAVPGGLRADRIGGAEIEWDGVDPLMLTTPFVQRGWPAPLIGNDGSLAAFAEARSGAAVGHRNAVVLFLGRGLGGSAIVDGALIRGATAAPGFGHTPLDPSGEACICGLRGCAELSASLLHVAQLLGETPELEHVGPSAYVDTLAARAGAGDPAVRGTLAAAADTLARLGDVLVALLNPELVVLTGPGAALAPWVLPDHVGSTVVPTVAGTFGADVVLVGALAAAQEAELGDPLRSAELTQTDWV